MQIARGKRIVSKGAFSNILQRVTITGTVQVASSAIADKLVPMTTTTAAGVEVKIDSLSREVANNFIVGTSAADQVASSIGLESHSSTFDLDASITSFMVDPMARPIVGRTNALGILEHAELTAGMFIGSMYSVAETAFDTAHGISTAMPGGHAVARALVQPTLTQQLTAATFTISQNGFMPIWEAKKAEVKTGIDSAIGNFDAGII